MPRMMAIGSMWSSEMLMMMMEIGSVWASVMIMVVMEIGSVWTSENDIDDDGVVDKTYVDDEVFGCDGMCEDGVDEKSHDGHDGMVGDEENKVVSTGMT